MPRDRLGECTNAGCASNNVGACLTKSWRRETVCHHGWHCVVRFGLRCDAFARGLTGRRSLTGAADPHRRQTAGNS